MASQDIQKHFKKLRIASPATRRQRVDPFSEGFSDESDNEKEDASKPAATNKPAARAPAAKASRGSIASPFASVAYLDDSEDEPRDAPKKRADKQTSPAPMAEDATKPSSSDKAPVKARASRSSIASPFPLSGTQYLEDSDSGEEAISDSRKASTHSTTEQPLQELAPDDPGPLSEQSLRVKRVDKLNPAGSGVSWKAFRAQSDSRTALKAAEIEALRASLNQRGKSISFSTHAITDEGKRLPIEVAKSVEEPGVISGDQAQHRRAGSLPKIKITNSTNI
ncbi:hypothetical protein B0A49_05333 [Cryomyces minteri]|uniref:Uncharacterized protein n=1 Tax=Cryomyces minteri TaxID=331657 RepID=A0A4U0X699_9PEZI|nr:hypothetical protein B0A49_05333 [Cryomyces minteri]